MEGLRTSRLLLRRWRAADREPFARMGTDPAVMEFMPKLLDRAESDAAVDRIEAHFAARGFGFWAVEEPDGEPFIGFVGLLIPSFEAHFTPAVEIGWRLARSTWGKGYATEAAREACRFAFEDLKLSSIVSMTVPTNLRSQRVMTKLGMTRDPADDFDHPRVPEGNPMRRHVLYRLSAARWLEDAPR